MDPGRTCSMALLVASLFIAAPFAQKEEETDKKKDRDSVELVVTGCLKGRALQAEEVRPAKENEQVPVIQARTFRVNGAREMLDELKKQNNRYVEATGRVKRLALTAPGPGISVGGARITVTPGSMGNPSRAPQYDTNAGVLHIDVTAVRVLAGNCSLK
ncbi:MAG: hypothetical protein ACRD1S_08330 [Vicinamibacterales bacterium]